MSMSTHVEGLRDPESKKHQSMIAAVAALDNAGVRDWPDALSKYFVDGHPGDDTMAGCVVDIDGCVEESTTEGCDHRVVDIRNLPDGVTHIRFSNCY